MIHRNRNTPPVELVTRSQDWNNSLGLDPESDFKSEWDSFRRTHIYHDTRALLSEMYSQKCCFCEIKTGDRIVEHFEPKSLSRHRMFEYDNLHLICSGCNSKKSNKTVTEVIDPSVDNPAEHLVFKTQEVVFCDRRGEVTIASVNLNRVELQDLRQAMLHVLKYKIDSIVGHLSEVLTVDSLRRYMADLHFIRQNNFSESSPFSKLLLDNFERNIDDLELIITNRIQEAENQT